MAAWLCHAAFFLLLLLSMTTRQNPGSNAGALVRDAVACLQSEQYDRAEALCSRVLAQQPTHNGALAVLGLIHYKTARFGEAEQAFAELTRRVPAEPMHWMNLGTAQRSQGKADAALSAYARAAALGASSADFFYNVGLAHLDRRDYESARAVLARAMQLAPRDAAIRLEYVKACYESLHTEEAIAALEGWQQLEGLDRKSVADIGQRLMNLGESERAEQVVQQLAASRDLDPHAGLILAQILERTNRLDEARAVIDRLDASPGSHELGVDLVVTRAQLAQRDSRHEEACRLFREALERRPEFISRHFELFPLAKSLDALGRYEEAFDTLTEAHASQVEYLKQTAPVAYARGAPTMMITEYRCDPDDVAGWDDAGAPSADESPIFIVAFPRSGTTLLELTLDAHPLLRSTDEQPFVQNALEDLIAAGARYPERLAGLSAAQLDDVRARYWERVRRKIRLEPGQRLVDKNPLNLMRLPAMRRLFPNARILLAVRHPCDVLLSCFMQHFRAPEFALLCSRLDTLAGGYHRTFDFWYSQAALLRPMILEVRYETFVADFADQVRAISDFLELPWNDAMLAPGNRAKARGFISTPSYSQVVQPVSTKSVGHWRAYERHLRAIVPQMRPWLERWSYEA